MYRTLIPCLIFAAVAAAAASMEGHYAHVVASVMALGSTLFLGGTFYLARQERKLRIVRQAIPVAGSDHELARLMRLRLDISQHMDEVAMLFDVGVVVIVTVIYMLVL